MAQSPAPPSGYTPAEWDDFVKRLTEYHEKRGTANIFEAEPKIGQQKIDLLKLWKRVNELGGYDHVSDTRASPLAWKRIGEELGYDKASHQSAIAFLLKSVYYKNLAAYEISTVHKREPPPPEILEHVTAKGGGLLTRTLANYGGGIHRSQNGDDDETPKKETEEEADSGERARRGLRHAPPPRQLFQAEQAVSSGKNRGTAHSPAPNANTAVHNFGNATAAQALANYEPKPQIPLTLRAVTTPANNPDTFKAAQAAIRDAHLARMSRYTAPPKAKIMLPGSGFPGPNVYIRTWMALRSPILEEQAYALHHLVKISYERGDKYRLDNFSGLAEALIDKLLETAGFYYDLSWDLDYSDMDTDQPVNVLDALRGTPNVVERLQSAQLRNPQDGTESSEMDQRLKLVREAGLVLRNMIMLAPNAEYVSQYPAVRDAIVLLLHLPNDVAMTEIKHYGLEIAEQLAKYLLPLSDDPLVAGLTRVARLSTDRSAIITSLRALGGLGTRLDKVMHLQDVPVDLVRRVAQWLLVEDQELYSACLEFLYRFTANVDGVELLLQDIDLPALIRQLVRLLQYGARVEEQQDTVAAKAPPAVKPPASENVQIPRISKDHIDMLLTYDEPERSTQWLRACFEENPRGEVTQIALWQAYQMTFTPYASASRPLMPAKGFITNVSTTFAAASAQVLQHVSPPVYVIRGIKPREVPVDPKGKAFMKCKWVLDADANGNVERECGGFAQTPQRMWEHLVTLHLGIERDATTGNFDFAGKMDGQPRTCKWAGCRKFDRPGAEPASAFAAGMHFKTHLPDTSTAMAYQRSKHNQPAGAAKPTVVRSWTDESTYGDDPAHVAPTAALVLRNLARNLDRTRAGREAAEGEAGASVAPTGSLAAQYFLEVRPRLFYVAAHNRVLADVVGSVLSLVQPAAPPAPPPAADSGSVSPDGDVAMAG